MAIAIATTGVASLLPFNRQVSFHGPQRGAGWEAYPHRNPTQLLCRTGLVKGANDNHIINMGILSFFGIIPTNPRYKAFQMLRNMSVKSQLMGMLFGVLLLLVTFSAVVWFAVSSMSGAADDMGQGKDVVADILPPPLYVIEAELTVLQLQDAKPDEVSPLLAKLNALKKDYDDRNSYWNTAPLDASVKRSLLGEQKQAADNFWKLVMGDFVAAMGRGDREQIRHVASEVSKAYMSHRNGVDATVKMASTYAESTLNSLRSTSERVRMTVLLLAGGGGLFVAFIMSLVIGEIMRRLGGEPLEMQAAARRIADGDLTGQMTATAGDGTSLLASIMNMQSNLRDTITQSRLAAEQVASSLSD